jgi:DinB superfamily
MDTGDVPNAGGPGAIGRLESMPAFLDEALQSVSLDDLVARPAAGEFSLVEQACHLRDLEREGYLVRVRRILAETLPQLEGFDGAAVARARNYSAQDPYAAARDFAAARREVASLLAAASARDLEREAMFDGKRITLRELIAMMEQHDRGHREEIERLIEALEDL